jgi:hypothetical protein
VKCHHFRFEQSVAVSAESGLPTALESVGQSIAAIEALHRSIRDRVHWRFALSMLRFVSAGQASDVEVARRALASALMHEGWLLQDAGAPRQGSPTPD